MIAQGTDGVSRESLKEGVALGEVMISFCPWGMSALDTEENLKEWIQSWAPSNSLFLEPKDWFIRGHDITGYYKDNKGHWRPEHEEGVYIWTPPPAAADVCIEEIRKARMKRKDSLHIIIIQKLFTTNWLRQLNKIADCHFLIPPTHNFWRPKNYENLVVAIVYPFLPFRPWQLQGTPKMFSVGRELCQMFKSKDVDSGNILRKFLLECGKFSTLPADVVWRMLYYRNVPPFSRSLPGDVWWSEGKRKRDTGDKRKITRGLERKDKGSHGLPTSKRRRTSNDTLCR